jgi:cytochrome o ubiquinol oxidase subunit 2
VLSPAGPVSRAESIILLDSLAIMLAIVIPTILAALAFAWWFRASNTRARYLPTWSYSGRIELIVWSIPTLVILFLGGVIWTGSHDLDPASPIGSNERPLEVQVVSLDWKWLFIYPQQNIASVNQLIVPAGVPLHFCLTSGSVMNVFFVPRLGSMIYTMNRMVTQLYLEAERPGDFFGESAQFSGDGFSDMIFTVHVVPKIEFPGWIATVRNAGPVLDRKGYAVLSRQSHVVRPLNYRAVDAGLFQAVVAQELPPAPGPDTGVAGSSVRPQTEE